MFFLKIHFYDPFTCKAIATVPGPLGIELHVQWLSSSSVIFLQENAVKAIKAIQTGRTGTMNMLVNVPGLPFAVKFQPDSLTWSISMHKKNNNQLTKNELELKIKSQKFLLEIGKGKLCLVPSNWNENVGGATSAIQFNSIQFKSLLE